MTAINFTKCGSVVRVGHLCQRQVCKGVTAVYDCIIACMILSAGIATAVTIIPAPPPEYEHDLGEYATQILVFLDSNGKIAPLVHAQDVAGIDRLIEGLLPEGYGYAVSVYSPELELLWSFSSQSFNSLNAAGSATYPLPGRDEPTLHYVTLSLSRR
ncbi:MAG: hypothetical protein QFX34_02990 [Candidatus Verstraetearchaeota archaeon]|nr:hypothetical protein [Candidatus Verstraetearchaeota archaeon]